MTRIDIYAENHGWLFEDMKSWFSRQRLEGIAISVGDHPAPDADVWIALRTREAGRTDAPERTVACVHDLYDDPGLYHPAGTRGAVHDVGGLVLCHPAQRRLLAKSGVDLDRKEVLERPLGALPIFTPREELPEKFTIGWVGRNDPRKRSAWLVEALLRSGIEPGAMRVILVGDDLGEIAGRLWEGGIECAFHDRRDHSIEECPSFYRAMDLLLITSATEAGPLTLFEALASGIPVISTPVGWAPHFARMAPAHVRLAGSPAAMGAALRDLRNDRHRLFDERYRIARLPARWRLDDWYRDVIALAASLARTAVLDEVAGHIS